MCRTTSLFSEDPACLGLDYTHVGNRVRTQNLNVIDFVLLLHQGPTSKYQIQKEKKKKRINIKTKNKFNDIYFVNQVNFLNSLKHATLNIQTYTF
jgi:hypothetical protein